MCYDIKASLESQLKRARRKNNLQAIEEIIEKLVPYTDLPIYHASGFSHPELLIYTRASPDFPEVATWGLVPAWVKDQEQQEWLWNKTLNARGETIFEKKSFKNSAKHNPCLIYVDGFYEHHYYKGKTFPFYIHKKSNDPLTLAGLYSIWKNKQTGGVLKSFTIVTTKGNKLMKKIHNNPKLKEARMPLILTEKLEEKWLNKLNEDNLQELLTSFPDDELQAYTVQRLRGKNYIGNEEEISNHIEYKELMF